MTAASVRILARVLGVAASLAPIWAMHSIMQGHALTLPMQHMQWLGIIGAIASLLGWWPVMALSALASFFPVGLYTLGVENEAVVAGIGNLGLMGAAVLAYRTRARKAVPEKTAT
jgi:hypothetical protein